MRSGEKNACGYGGVQYKMKKTVIVSLISICIVSATPLDTVYDFMLAMETCDGTMAVNLLSSDLQATLNAALAGFQEIAGADGPLTRELLNHYGFEAEPWEVSSWDITDFMDAVLESSRFSVSDFREEVEEENVSMTGRKASVVLVLKNRSSIKFDLVWENNSWKLVSSSLLNSLFNR